MPYRPLFAFPEKLRQVLTDFKYFDACLFNVLDPTRTLGPATAMVPKTTSIEPEAPLEVSLPGIILDPGPTIAAASVGSSRPKTQTVLLRSKSQTEPTGNGYPLYGGSSPVVNRDPLNPVEIMQLVVAFDDAIRGTSNNTLQTPTTILYR